ncbi:MAG: hypothetical protein KKA19_05440, partial [Candidatus Margulisbacteria bacterium]|nr:hypothetical protein [Candidatus Margulisiibacteriota bacterium]
MGENVSMYVVSALAGLALAVWIYYKEEKDKIIPFISLIAVSFSFWNSFYLLKLAPYSQIFYYFIPPLLLHFSLSKIRNRFIEKRYLETIYIVGGLLALLDYIKIPYLIYGYLIFLMMCNSLAVFLLRRRYSRTLSSAEKNNIKYLISVILIYSLAALGRLINPNLYILGNFLVLGMISYLIF